MTLEDHDHRNRDWDQNRTTELKALRACGLSCGEIRQKMGFSRNSIIGKLYRMGFAVPQEAQDSMDRCGNANAQRLLGIRAFR